MFNLKLIFTMLAGLFFGLWPLLMNRSGMNANTFMVMAVLFTLVCVFPFFVKEFNYFSGVNWKYAISAFVTGTIGAVIFNNVMEAATKKEVGGLFVAMTMVQISVPAIYSIFMNGGLTGKNVFGFFCAVLAVWAFS